MALIMVIPLMVAAFSSLANTKSVTAATNTQLVVTKVKFNLKSNHNLIVGDDGSAETNINNQGGVRDNNDKDAGEVEPNVNFALFGIPTANNANISDKAWTTLGSFIEDFQSTRESFTPLTYGVNSEDEVTLTKNGSKTLASAIRAAYRSVGQEPLFDAGKYPNNSDVFNQIIFNLLDVQLADIFEHQTPTKHGGITADNPFYRTNASGQLTYNVTDPGRYILVEQAAANQPGAKASGKVVSRQVSKPMTIDVPTPQTETVVNESDGNVTKNIHIYPKNDIPEQAAQFTKVNGSDENLPGLAGAKFALFEFTGDNTAWATFNSNVNQLAMLKPINAEKAVIDDYADADDYDVLLNENSAQRKLSTKWIKSGDDDNSNLFVSDEDGKVTSPELEYGRYFFVEVAAPDTFTLNSFPIYFEVKADNVDGDLITPQSYAQKLDASLADYSDYFPNYEKPAMTKSLDVIATNPDSESHFVPDSEGVYWNNGGTSYQAGDIFRYTLSTSVDNPQLLSGNFLAFYDVFMKNSAYWDNDGSRYETWGSSDHITDDEKADGITFKPRDEYSWFQELLDANQLFKFTPRSPSDSKPRGEKVAHDFFDPITNAIDPSVVTTGLAHGSLPSTLVIYSKAKDTEGNAIPLGYFGDTMLQEDADKYGMYFGPFALNADGDGNGIGAVGWYDTDLHVSNAWEELGTPTGTQLYWAIDAARMREAIRSALAGADKLTATGNAAQIEEVLNQISKLNLEFDLEPKDDFSAKQVQALHNIGQFEWNSWDPEPYNEDTNDAYIGGQVFQKFDQANKSLISLPTIAPVEPDAVDEPGAEPEKPEQGEMTDDEYAELLDAYNEQKAAYEAAKKAYDDYVSAKAKYDTDKAAYDLVQANEFAVPVKPETVDDPGDEPEKTENMSDGEYNDIKDQYDKDKEKYDQYLTDLDAYETAKNAHDAVLANSLAVYQKDNRNGHFYVTRKVDDGTVQYLKYDKERDLILGWTTNESEATLFHTIPTVDKAGKTIGQFKVYGLAPNAHYDNEAADEENYEIDSNRIVSGDYGFVPDNKKNLQYFIGEVGDLKIGTNTYHKMDQDLEFWVAPLEWRFFDKDGDGPFEGYTDKDSQNAIGTSTVPLYPTKLTNIKSVIFPDAGGLGILAFILLGLTLIYAAYRYFKYRRNHLVTE
ncbi:SpaA isopeptide-forming pilin-related protein [Periweissella cryptocerci]|nr:SpaA isopeptide-forming pilin-related protein [Periweissella cryptocerci]